MARWYAMTRVQGYLWSVGTRGTQALDRRTCTVRPWYFLVEDMVGVMSIVSIGVAGSVPHLPRKRPPPPTHGHGVRRRTPFQKYDDNVEHGTHSFATAATTSAWHGRPFPEQWHTRVLPRSPREMRRRSPVCAGSHRASVRILSRRARDPRPSALRAASGPSSRAAHGSRTLSRIRGATTCPRTLRRGRRGAGTGRSRPPPGTSTGRAVLPETGAGAVGRQARSGASSPPCARTRGTASPAAPRRRSR